MSCETITQKITVLAPDLSADVSQDDLDCLIEMAETITPTVIEKKYFDYLVALYVCHLLVLRTRGGQGGSVTNLKEGNLAMSFGSTGKKDSLESTSYGELYKYWKDRILFFYRSRIRID